MVNVIEQHNLVYGSVLGAALIADIAYPKDRRKMPAVISVHGGRWIRGTRHDDGLDGRPNNGVVELRRWAEAGFFTMRIDYRLVTCSPAPACFQDVMCALRWTHAHASKFSIDPDQIFLIGQSAGAHLVSLAATLGPRAHEQLGGWEDARSDFAAGVSISGAYDLISLDWGSGWCPPGVPWDVARTYASPIEHAAGDSNPLLVFHAEDDKSVPIDQADSFVRKMKEVGAPHTYHRYTTGGHLKINDLVYNECQTFIQSLTAEGRQERKRVGHS